MDTDIAGKKKETKLYDHQKTYLQDPSFSMMPIHTLETVDFSGRAAIIYDKKIAEIDLIVDSINFTYKENDQVTPHIGDTFSTIFFGKAPLEINVQASLPDSLENFGKTNLLNAYKNYYRASAVARIGIAPSLRCRNMVFTGPFTRLTVSEQSDNADNVLVVFTMVVMQFYADGDDSQISLDWVHGMDSVVADSEETSALESKKGSVSFEGLSPAQKQGYFSKIFGIA